MKYLVHVPEGNLFLTKEEIFAKVKEILDACPSEHTCVYRVWYEGFEGCGVVSTEVKNIILGIYLGADRLCCDVPLETMDFLKNKMPWLNIIY